jgi:catechol 2,3-dioxygenase-like lactoylglutathione lyase family enzyme
MSSLLGFFALDHVGIAVASPDSPLTGLLGDPPTLKEMPSGVTVGRFGPDMRLELVVPTRIGSPIERFLQRRGPGLHHIALQVDEPLTVVIERLEAAGVSAVGPIEPASDGRPSLFLHPSGTDGVLIELVEGPRPA